MTRKEFLGAYNIGHRDGKEGEYLPNDYDDIFHIEEPKTDVLEQIKEEIKQTYEQEKEIDSKWAAGLKYSLKIIDNALKEVEQ